MSVRATPLTMIWRYPAIRISSPAILINSIYFDFLWIGEIRGNYLMNSLGDGRKITVVGMDWTPNSDPTSNIIPESTNAVFQLDHESDYILDDCTDYLWFNMLIGTQRSVTHSEMISDNYRTLIKYSNTAPFNITAIGILKSTVILTQPIINEITADFWLWAFWSQIWNDYGYLKNNRTMFLSNIVAIGSGTLTPRLPNDAPSNLVATAFSSTRIDLTWDNPAGSYSGNRIYRSTDNINFTLIDTIAINTSYSATGLTAGTTYYFKVQTFSGLFSTIYSNIDNDMTLPDPPTDLTVGWENDYAVMDFVDHSGGTLGHEVYEAEGTGSYSLVTTLAAGVTHYHNYTSQGITMHYRIKAVGVTGYSNVIDYETPLVFQTDQNPISAELSMYLANYTVYGGTPVTVDWGDGTTPIVYTNQESNILKTYSVVQDPYFVKIWGGGNLMGLYLPTMNIIKGDLSKWKRSIWFIGMAYTYASALPTTLLSGCRGCSFDSLYANTHLSIYPRGELVDLDYYFARGGYASQAEVDDIYAYFNTYFGTHTPTKDISIRINGGYYQVTGGDANADVIGIKAKFTAAGHTATIYTTA
jgi:hypothetical protein